MARDVTTNNGSQADWRIVIAAIFQINQAMSRIYSVGAAVAITLWSARCLRSGQLSRAWPSTDASTAPLIAILIFVGHLRLGRARHGRGDAERGDVVRGHGSALWRPMQLNRHSAADRT